MAWSDIQVSLVGFTGNKITLSAKNPQSHAETARVGVDVNLAGGGQAALRSGNLNFAANETKEIVLTASGPIASISDSPEPFPPA